MSMLSIPQTLSPSNVEKAIRAASGGKKAGFDPKELTSALKQLEKLDSAVEASLFEPAGADTAEAARQRLAALEAGPLKAAQATAAQATKVAQFAAKAQSALKADKSADPKIVDMVAEVAGDARGYASDLLKAAQGAQAELKALLARLLASEKKGAQKEARKEADSKKEQDEEDAEEADHAKDLAAVGARVATALKQARTTGTAKPMKFMIGVLKKQVFVYVAKATSGSTVARIKRLMEAGAQSVTIYRGECVFENKAYTFVSVNIPTGGFAMRMQKALAELTGKKYKIRVRRPTGETDEAAGDDDEADAEDALAQATKQGGKDAARAAAVLERHKKLKPAIDQILNAGGPLVGAARAAVAAFDAKVGAKKFDDALKALDQLENGVLKEARALAEAKAKAEKEIADRLKRLLPDIRKLVSAGGDAADDVKKRLQKVQDATRNAARSTAKDAYALAQREFKQLQEAVESAPPAKGVAGAARAAAGQVDKARAELERKRALAQKNIAKITDAARRAEVEALMKAIDAAAKTAEKLVDAKRQAEAIEKIVKQVEKVTEKAIDYAVDKARKMVEPAIDKAGKMAGKVAEAARKAAAPVVSAAERAQFKTRFGELAAKVKELAATGAADADKLRREVLAAGKQASDASGLAKALQQVGELEKKVLASARSAAGG